MVACLMLCLKLGCNRDGGGGALHAFNLEGLDGTRFYWGEQRGKIVVLVFWSVYCVPCHRQLSALTGHSLMKDPQVKIVSVCVDPNDRALVEQGAKMSGGRIPVLLDYNATMKKKLGVKTEPTTLIVDGNGIEVGRIVGYDKSTLSQISKAVVVTKQRAAR